MAVKRHIKPAEGRVLRDHNDRMRQIPDEGKIVDFDVTWAKRVKQGDAILVIQKPAAPAPKKQAEPKAEPKAEAVKETN